jgi:regulator of replication initiation timing
MDWQQFVLQLVAMAVPVAIAIIKQNQRITHLEENNTHLQRDNEELSRRLDDAVKRHNELQARYEAALKASAGLRGSF